MQLTNISHVRDLSSMLTLAVEDPVSSNGKIFNCVSDRAVTFDGLAKLCAQAAGCELKIIHYDPKAVGIDAKKTFPFRNMVMLPTSFCCVIIPSLLYALAPTSSREIKIHNFDCSMSRFESQLHTFFFLFSFFLFD